MKKVFCLFKSPRQRASFSFSLFHFFCKGTNDCKIALPEMRQDWIQNVGNINSPKNCVLPWQMILWLNIQKVQHSATSRSSYRLYKPNARYVTRGKTFKALKTFNDHTCPKICFKTIKLWSYTAFSTSPRTQGPPQGGATAAAAAGSAHRDQDEKKDQPDVSWDEDEEEEEECSLMMSL